MTGTSSESLCAVLVVDDDDDVRESFAELLEDRGHRVFAAENGRQALEVLDSLPRPAVVMLDLMMPVMNGPEFLAQLRRGPHRDLPVVVVSAFSERADGLPAQAALAKPLRPALLFRTLDRLACPEPT